MLQKRRSFGARKVSPPQPTCMTEEQKASYLASLRNNRPPRPTGSRPLPSKSSQLNASNASNEQPTIIRSGSALSLRQNDDKIEDNRLKRFSVTHSASVGDLKGRPLVMSPNGLPMGRRVTPPEIVYRESAARQLERREAHSLRQALEKIDHGDEEVRIYDAAQMEAADLVWKHRNPHLAEQERTAPYKNPDLAVAKKRYVIENQGSALDRQQKPLAHRSASGSSNNERDDQVQPLRISKRGSQDFKPHSASEKVHATRRKSSNSRRVSSGGSKGVFRNPEDQIYEEPEIVETMTDKVKHDSPLRSRTQNPLLRGSRPLPVKPDTMTSMEQRRMNRVDIYKNLPSQTRDAEYKTNPEIVLPAEAPERAETPKGRTMEIRSDEIRAATSMKRSDRSPKLPTPTAVSDKFGRPIVSFDPAWKPPTYDLPGNSQDVERSPHRPTPARTIAATPSASPIPAICLPEDDTSSTAKRTSTQIVPQLNLPDASISVPTINITGEADCDVRSRDPPATQALNKAPLPRPLPSVDRATQNRPGQRPLPSHTQSAPSRLPPMRPAGSSNRLPWLSRSPTPSVAGGNRAATVTCTACSLPIAGRIVTASGSSASSPKVRFHPECFTCHHCSTGLECVSFYPEPEAARMDRLTLNAEDAANGHSDDNETDVRFYCHLDYHDLFSPRCASCHTPIEGAVILAAGKAWHKGHFFCAECGDPFSSSSPFVESNGYAYCVGCHTRRTSARCRSCKKQILDEVSVEALGGKWHEDCFKCDDCGGDFGDDGRFFVREIELQLTEKEKRRGLEYRKIEERAVCEGCEGRRLKSKDIVAFL